MYVAYLNNYPSNTGIGRYTLEIFQGVREEGVNADLYCIGQEGKTFPESIILTDLNPPLRWIKSLYLPFSIRRKLDIKKYNLIHISNQNLAYFIPQLKTLNLPIIITVHDAYYRLRFERLYWRYILKRIFSNIPYADLIIVNSNFTKHDLLNNLDIEPSKIRVIYLGVNHNIFKPMDKVKARENLNLLNKNTEDDVVLLTAGDKPKDNIKTVLKSFKKVKSIYSNIRLLILGNKEKLVKYITDEDLLKELEEGKIRIFEEISDYQLMLLYNAADIFVHPTLYEGFGLSLLEAISCGIPTITSKISAVPEIVGEGALYICDPLNYTELSEKIINLIKDQRLYNELRWRGLNFAKNFSWEKTIKETIRAYEQLNN